MKVSLKCLNCNIKIFGEKKEGDIWICYKCGQKMTIKNNKYQKVEEVYLE